MAAALKLAFCGAPFAGGLPWGVPHPPVLTLKPRRSALWFRAIGKDALISALRSRREFGTETPPPGATRAAEQELSMMTHWPLARLQTSTAPS